ERVERAFEIPMLIAAVLVIPTIVIEESHVGQPWDGVAVGLNWLIWVAFATELVVMLAVVPARRQWLARHPLDLVIVVVTPPFLPAALQSARVLRLLRLLRLLKLAKHAKHVFSLAGLRFAAVLAVLTALGGGAAFAEAEHETTWHGIYWAITTMTTVGYGDLNPTTDTGRAIAIAVMLVGIGFVAILTGAIAQRFLAQDVEHVEAVISDLETDEQGVLRQVRALAAQVRPLEAALERQAQ